MHLVHTCRDKRTLVLVLKHFGSSIGLELSRHIRLTSPWGYQGSACLLSPVSHPADSGITDVPHYTWLFTWILGARTHILTLARLG